MPGRMALKQAVFRNQVDKSLICFDAKSPKKLSCLIFRLPDFSFPLLNSPGVFYRENLKGLMLNCNNYELSATDILLSTADMGRFEACGYSQWAGHIGNCGN